MYKLWNPRSSSINFFKGPTLFKMINHSGNCAADIGFVPSSIRIPGSRFVMCISVYWSTVADLRVYPHRAASVSGRLDLIGMYDAPHEAWKRGGGVDLERHHRLALVLLPLPLLLPLDAPLDARCGYSFRGREERAPGVQILSISCRFGEILEKLYVAPPWGVGTPSWGKSWIYQWFGIS